MGTGTLTADPLTAKLFRPFYRRHFFFIFFFADLSNFKIYRSKFGVLLNDSHYLFSFVIVKRICRLLYRKCLFSMIKSYVATLQRKLIDRRYAKAPHFLAQYKTAMRN